MRMAVRHGYRHPLLWRESGRAMLPSYAHHPVYLNVACLHGCCCSNRVQMGGREWCRSLQRPAPRECPESGVESTPDVFRSEGSGDRARQVTAAAAEDSYQRLPELCDIGADQRPGFHEHLVGRRRRERVTPRSARRHGGRDDGRAARSRCSRERWTVHDLPGGSRYSLHTSGRSGRGGQIGLPVGECDIPRPPAVAAGTAGAGPPALVFFTAAATLRSWVCRGG